MLCVYNVLLSEARSLKVHTILRNATLGSCLSMVNSKTAPLILVFAIFMYETRLLSDVILDTSLCNKLSPPTGLACSCELFQLILVWTHSCVDSVCLDRAVKML